MAGQHLYLIFDSALASQIYRHSQVFIFDPYFLMSFGILGATKEDLRIISMGAQTAKPITNLGDDGRRIIHDLHKMTPQYLTGKPLDSLTDLFIQTLCADIDSKFPINVLTSYEWQTLDILAYVKTTWAHASITALFGSNIYTIWPEIEKWLWLFDEHFQSLFTKLPRFLLPLAWALRDEGWEKCAQWEREARKSEANKLFGEDPDWDPYWGLRFVRKRATYLKESGISDKARAGNQMVFIWGLNANAIPIAMQVMAQILQRPALQTSLLLEISAARTGLTSFDMRKVITSPKLKSVFQEALRWATASPSPRVVREDVNLGEFRLKKGNMAMVHSRTLQMDFKTWYIPGIEESRPENFWPERFLADDGSATESHVVSENQEAETNYSDDIKRTSKSEIEQENIPVQEKACEKEKERGERARMLSLRPFGGGTTLCPGRHFAINEILGGIAALLLRLEIEVLPDELKKNGAPTPGLKKQGGLLPDRGLMVRVRRRR